MIKNVCFLLLLCIALCTYVHAQPRLSLGFETGLPANFSKTAKVGLGGSLDGSVQLGNNVHAVLYAGYLTFKEKYLDQSISFVPVRIGARFFPTSGIFVDGQGGMVFFNSPSVKKTHPAFGVGAGYQLPVERNFVQFSGHFNYSKSTHISFTYFSLRVAYGFNFRKTQTEP